MVDSRREPRAGTRAALRFGLPAALIVASGLGLCHLKASPRASRGALFIDEVRKGPMAVEVRAAGTLVPEDMEWIPATVDGRVERVIVEPGADVGAGSLILVLSNPQLEQAAEDAALQVRAAEAELRSRQLQLSSGVLQQEAIVAAIGADAAEARDRAAADAELAQSGLTSALVLNASRGRAQQLGVRLDVERKRLELLRRSELADLAAAGARLDQLRAMATLRRQQFDALQIRAGRAGVVQQVAAEPGARVTAGTNVARVAARAPLKAVLQVSQLEVSQIVRGQRVRIDTHGGIVIGTVSRIDPAVRDGSVIVDVRLPRDLPQGARPDLSVDAAIEIDRVDNAMQTGRPVHVRANTSIELFRLAADGRSATRVPVRIGRTSFNAIEIVSGLQSGDRVILSDTSAYEHFERIALTD